MAGSRSGATPTARITDSTISGNSVRTTNWVADAIAFSGGLNIADVNTRPRLRDVVIARNDVTAAAARRVGRCGGRYRRRLVGGHVLDTRLVDNTVSVRSAAGDATAAAGAAFTRGLIADSLVERQLGPGFEPGGTALAAGGALVVEAELDPARHDGESQHRLRQRPAGLRAGRRDLRRPPVHQRRPADPRRQQVVHNVATGTARITLQGGGIYIAKRRLTLVRSTVGDNVPDQICGC